MEIAFLGSSSSGNSTLLCSGDSRILIDAGISARELEARLELVGHSPKGIDAILLSHEHTDHCRGAGILSRKYGIPVMANPPTFAMSPIGNVDYREFMTQEEFEVGEFKIRTYPVPHNAAEPVCFSIETEKHKIGFATDLGKVTQLIHNVLSDKDILIIEANHDEHMLRTGSYPEFLKKTIASPQGHLSNRATAAAVASMVTDRTQGVYLVHLSEENNTPEKAEHEVRSSLSRKLKSTKVQSAERFRVTPPINLR
jgi:phosphoribosyl 1,2-cyclic phosphodiesterase